MKTCSRCRLEKVRDKTAFYADKNRSDGFSSRCIDCVKAAAAESYSRNPQAARNRIAAWQKANPDCRRKYAARVAADPDLLERDRETKRRSAERHREAWTLRRRERERNRWREDLNYRLGKVIGHQIRRAVIHGKRRQGWSALVGYEAKDLRLHLERQFVAGMTWENYGEWEIDHVHPVASFDFSIGSDEVRACWSLSNLRPLWKVDNRAKGAKILLLA